MQYLDNNIEELFIKASEGYSIKTPNDWEVIASLLQNDKIIRSKKLNWLKTTRIFFSMSILSFLTVELKDNKVIFEKNNVSVNANTTNLKINTTEKSSNKSISQRVIFEIRNFNQFHEYNKTIFYPLKASASFQKINETFTNKHLQIVGNSFENNPFLKDNMVVKNDNFDKNNLTNIIANSIESIIPNSIISAENIAKPSSKESDPKVSQKGNKQFYIGIQTGLSYSQIKSQGFTKPGYNIGLIAGFAFSKKWMVETGLLLTNKSYYTSGEYFNSPKSDPFMPVGMVVKS